MTQSSCRWSTFVDYLCRNSKTITVVSRSDVFIHVTGPKLLNWLINICCTNCMPGCFYWCFSSVSTHMLISGLSLWLRSCFLGFILSSTTEKHYCLFYFWFFYHISFFTFYPEFHAASSEAVQRGAYHQLSDPCAVWMPAGHLSGLLHWPNHLEGPVWQRCLVHGPQL